jgi:hypothetical protein
MVSNWAGVSSTTGCVGKGSKGNSDVAGSSSSNRIMRFSESKIRTRSSDRCNRLKRLRQRSAAPAAVASEIRQSCRRAERVRNETACVIRNRNCVDQLAICRHRLHGLVQTFPISTDDVVGGISRPSGPAGRLTVLPPCHRNAGQKVLRSLDLKAEDERQTSRG